MAFVYGEQRRVGVGAKQAPPLLAIQARDLVEHMRKSIPSLASAALRIATAHDIAAVFCLVFHTMKRGFELPVAVAALVICSSCQRTQGFIFNFLFGKTLRSSSVLGRS